MAIITFTGLQPINADGLAKHPSLERESWLPQLVKSLRREFKDPRSIRDLQVCNPVKIKWKNGAPKRWTVQFSANAKNEMGGYTGIQTYAAVFKLGKRVRIISTGMVGSNGFDGIINDAIWRQIEDCPILPDAQVLKYLGYSVPK